MNLSDLEAVNEVYTTFFPDSAIARTVAYVPARTAVEVAGLPMNALVQIEAVVSHGDGTPPQAVEDRHGIVIKPNNTDKAPKCALSTQTVAFSHYNHISAQLPVDAKTGELVAGGVKEQAAQCLSHIKAIVESIGHKMDDVVKVNVFVKNIDDMAAVDEAYATFFPGYVPARRTVGVANLPKGALALAISRGLNKRVKLILCCAENLVSGHAFKLGDILTYRNGISVEIQNTDAEGRLVLADGLLAASESGAAYILDAATLTGAAKTALGRDYNAVFALDEAEQVRALAAANAENEKAWPLPLEPWHAGQLTSAFAELGNVASAEGTAGATTAAAFLSRFVRDEGRGWVHLDLAASYQKSGNDLWATGAKGHGLRTIARWLQEVCA